jgi:hypothetical protein
VVVATLVSYVVVVDVERKTTIPYSIHGSEVRDEMVHITEEGTSHTQISNHGSKYPEKKTFISHFMA